MEEILNDLSTGKVRTSTSVINDSLVISREVTGRKYRVEKSIWYMKTVFREYILFKRCFFLFWIPVFEYNVESIYKEIAQRR